MIFYTFQDSPLGRLLLVSDGQALAGLDFADRREGEEIGPGWVKDEEAAPFPLARAELAAYFAGKLRLFSVPLAPRGTPFQRSVWKTLQEIPYGETIPYRELARRAGRPAAVRAAGHANGRNPIAIIIPCHRVIGSDGKLTGYGGGLERKEALLRLEGVRAKIIQNGCFLV